MFGCGTRHNTFVARNYHNMTSRYNGYFYANESVKDGIQKIKKTHKEDYTKIIPVYWGPMKIMDSPLMQFCWMMLFDTIHHRGQLSVYLRLNDIPVPSIYGPSADEGQM